MNKIFEKIIVNMVFVNFLLHLVPLLSVFVRYKLFCSLLIIFRTKNNLKHLNLGSNNITLIETEMFKNLNMLTSISLRSNKIESIQSDSFIGLNNLISLDLNDQSLHNLSNGSFRGLVNLQLIRTIFQNQNQLRIKLMQ